MVTRTLCAVFRFKVRTSRVIRIRGNQWVRLRETQRPYSHGAMLKSGAGCWALRTRARFHVQVKCRGRYILYAHDSNPPLKGICTSHGPVATVLSGGTGRHKHAATIVATCEALRSCRFRAQLPTIAGPVSRGVAHVSSSHASHCMQPRADRRLVVTRSTLLAACTHSHYGGVC